MIKFKEKSFGLLSGLNDLDHKLNDKVLDKEAKKIKRRMKWDRDDSHLLTNKAKLQGIKQERFQNDLAHRTRKRSLQRAAEEKDLARARAIEDKNGTGNALKRGIQDATRNIKHGIQNASDKYFGSTSGRSLGGDLALAGLAAGAGYLAVKAIKKAKYDRP